MKSTQFTTLDVPNQPVTIDQSPSLSAADIAGFQRFIHRFHQLHGRHDLPWRQTTDPYHVLVSELMLQQTQVDRVIPKFEAFIDAFPSLGVLALASPAQVIQHWQGLGYNRRGLYLHQAAQAIMSQHGGQLPCESTILESLPGIGPYTAAAIQAFGFNLPAVVLETNIRAVFLFHFFHGAYNVDDDRLAPLVAQTLDQAHPRDWYAGLMDYGSVLKKLVPNPTRHSKNHVRQSRFQGSRRQTRGLILKLLTVNGPLANPSLRAKLEIGGTLTPAQLDELDTVLHHLQAEGFITQTPAGWQLAV